MRLNRLWTSVLLSTTLAGCAGLNLTAAQKAALGSLLAQAGLNVQLTDTSGNAQKLTASQISSVSFNGKTLTPGQYAVDANGNLTFNNVVKENAGVVPVVITLTNGQTLTYNYDTSAGAIQANGNQAVFVPGDDGRYHFVQPTPGQDLKQYWEQRHQEQQKNYWVTVDLALSDLSNTDPTFLMAVRPNNSMAQGFAAMLPRPFYDADASGDVRLDPQALLMAAAPPPTGFVPPPDFLPPSSSSSSCTMTSDGMLVCSGTGMSTSASTSTSVSSSTSTSTGVSSSTSTSTSMSSGAEQGPPLVIQPSQIQAATFIVVYTSDDPAASGSAKVVEFQITSDLQTPNLETHDLPPAQDVLAGQFKILATAEYPNIAAAAQAEGLMTTPPQAPDGPVLGIDSSTSMTTTAQQ